MEKIVLILSLVSLSLVSCSEKTGNPEMEGNVTAPSDVVIERTGTTSVRMTWKDNSDNETGFGIYFCPASDVDSREQIAIVDPDVTEYTMDDGLEMGRSYYLGVQAKGRSAEYDSRIINTLFKLEEETVEEVPVPVIESVESNDVCISVTYRIDNFVSGLEYGLCWSSEGSPDVDDIVQTGPDYQGDGTVFQVIPNALLEYGETYRIRAYAVTDDDTAVYSDEEEASLGTEPEAITLHWERLQFSGLPSDIEVYKTEEPLNGDSFNAWYAVADVASGNVELRVMVPSSAQTVDSQAAAADDCLVLVNGGYFYNGRHTGLAVISGTPTGTIPAVRGSLSSSDAEYNVMYNVTRGVFGTDASGKPSVYWAGTDVSGRPYYYSRPLPSVKGEARYPAPGADNPSPAVEWAPDYALSAGPVLLYDGKCPFDFSTTASGPEYYLSNYEIIPDDIFGAGVTPDRTAVGYTADGKIILFVCDGRIAESGGATLEELAAIMKGLGCVGAVNFDGGGSTGMAVCGELLNYHGDENRRVVSTIGFFVKK